MGVQMPGSPLPGVVLSWLVGSWGVQIPATLHPLVVVLPWWVVHQGVQIPVALSPDVVHIVVLPGVQIQGVLLKSVVLICCMGRQGVPIPAAETPEVASHVVVGLWSGLLGVLILAGPGNAVVVVLPWWVVHQGVQIPAALSPDAVHSMVLPGLNPCLSCAVVLRHHRLPDLSLWLGFDSVVEHPYRCGPGCSRAVPRPRGIKSIVLIY